MSRRCCLEAILFVTSALEISSLASAQSPSDFVLLSEQPAVRLVEVDRTTSDTLRFTFANISTKPILQVCISAQRGPKEMACMLGGTNGAKLPGPGEQFSISLDSRGFALDGQQNTISVDAVVYADGSHFGKKEALADIESRMAGVALESQRISDLLTSNSDPSDSGLDSIRAKVGGHAPSTPSEAAEALRGESIPGIPASDIQRYLSNPSRAFLEGVALERSAVIHDIDQEKAVAALPLTGGKNRQEAVLEARANGGADLAKKHRELNQQHAAYLRSFIEAGNAR